ncbi:MAG: hypothetical protein BWY85_01323 [Firmicutes bacterium ADurb.Bin506]|nr:MAG: hypothetical protein BWY85_01323 [Firmicutes bacterium ADurb.Bin506]
MGRASVRGRGSSSVIRASFVATWRICSSSRRAAGSSTPYRLSQCTWIISPCRTLHSAPMSRGRPSNSAACSPGDDITPGVE